MRIFNRHQTVLKLGFFFSHLDEHYVQLFIQLFEHFVHLDTILNILSARGTRALIHLAFHCRHHYVAPFPQIHHLMQL